MPEDTRLLDTHCTCLRRCVSLPVRTLRVFRVVECVCSVGLCGDNREVRPLIYCPINDHGNHQRSDADERRGNEMKNDKRNGGVKEKGL